MSSRKKRDQASAPNSNRNLDGRRIRTVDEAKALAAYLETKPDMDQKEKEERRKRWQKVVEDAERREKEMKEGKGRMTDAAWLEDKEEGEQRIRTALKKNFGATLLQESDESAENSEEGSSETSEAAAPQPRSKSKQTEATIASQPNTEARTVFGWDNDDEGTEEDDDGSDEQ